MTRAIFLEICCFVSAILQGRGEIILRGSESERLPSLPLVCLLNLGKFKMAAPPFAAHCGPLLQWTAIDNLKRNTQFTPAFPKWQDCSSSSTFYLRGAVAVMPLNKGS